MKIKYLISYFMVRRVVANVMYYDSLSIRFTKHLKIFKNTF